MTKPNLVIIGAQKSASTFVQNCLKQHPEIYLPDNETPYFEDPDYHGSARLDQLIGDRPEKVVGIKRPNYLCKSEVPERIWSDLPKAKLIVVLRDPVERLVSSYFHQIKYGTFAPVEFALGMRDILNGGPLSNKFLRSREMISFGYYGAGLSRYENFIKNGNTLILFHSEISEDPLRELKKCFSFLNVRADFIPTKLKSRPQRVIYSIPRLRWLGMRNRFLHDYNADLTRLSVKSMTWFDYMAVGLITVIDRYWLRLFFSNEKPSIDKELRKQLVNLYAKDIKVLEAIVDRDLSAWTR
jgi:hypothetical protein